MLILSYRNAKENCKMYWSRGIFVQSAGWLDIDSHESLRRRTKPNRSFYHTRFRLTDQVITEWMTFSLPGDTTVSAYKMLWTSNKPAQLTHYIYCIYIHGLFREVFARFHEHILRVTWSKKKKAIVLPEGLDKLKKPDYLIGNRTLDLPACSIVLQPTIMCKVLIILSHFVKFHA
jgi:hypothetical protein